MSEKLCVVMPVYNEQDAIGPVLEKWSKELDALGIDYTIRPYNDGSKDGSLAVMRQVASRLPRVDVRDKKNGGHGHAIVVWLRERACDILRHASRNMIARRERSRLRNGNF